jgi:hypothetical protein
VNSNEIPDGRAGTKLQKHGALAAKLQKLLVQGAGPRHRLAKSRDFFAAGGGLLLAKA